MGSKIQSTIFCFWVLEIQVLQVFRVFRHETKPKTATNLFQKIVGSKNTTPYQPRALATCGQT
eukprot:m.1650624 g.1650624  ORF g.1650624 m.1650624 type:complete len:63 (-) comp87291_c0_seq1:221-409(-)